MTRTACNRRPDSCSTYKAQPFATEQHQTPFFRLDPSNDALKTLHQFGLGNDGARRDGFQDGYYQRRPPYFVTGSDGANCVNSGCGRILKMTKVAARRRCFYTFTGGADGGADPQGLVRDSAGNLYGVSLRRNLTAPGSGTGVQVGYGEGVFTVLYTFTGGADGGLPTRATNDRCKRQPAWRNRVGRRF